MNKTLFYIFNQKMEREIIITSMVFNNFIICYGAVSTKFTRLIQSADT